MPPESSSGSWRPRRPGHLLQGILRLLLARGAVHAGQLQAKGRVVQHREVGHERKGLEHHGDVLAAQCAQFLVVERVDVLAVDQDAAAGGLDQAIEHAHQGGLARARQAHDEDFTGFDGEVGVEHADGLPGLGEDLCLLRPCFTRLSGFRIVAEDLEDMIDSDLLGHCGVLLLMGWNTVQRPRPVMPVGAGAQAKIKALMPQPSPVW
jgi:hypothetical protein